MCVLVFLTLCEVFDAEFSDSIELTTEMRNHTAHKFTDIFYDQILRYMIFFVSYYRYHLNVWHLH